jgi:hypothetical protein
MTKPFIAGAATVAALVTTIGLLNAQQRPAAERVPVDADDIGGVVSGPTGPEAGVWVIAETTDLPTKFRKIVVTDDRGRYLIPDLPKARYRVWVRGYGLVDSSPVQSAPGRELALAAVPAPNARAAAQYYPADAWLSLIQVPPKSEFPMTITVPAGGRGGPPAAGAAPQERVLATQAEWIGAIKGCMNCHELGNKATRELPAYLNGLSPIDAWERRLQFGQVNMLGAVVGGHGRDRGLAMYADWTNRIAAGELPPAPPRPQGVERSVVVTLWDVSTPTAFVHDIVSTDKRNPTSNPYGPVYGVEFHHDSVMVLDPKTNSTELVPIPTRIPKNQMQPFTPQRVNLPSPVWGEEIIFEDFVNPNNATMDAQGRVWMSAQVRGPMNPAYCQDPKNQWAALYPVAAGRRQLSVYDPKTKTFIDFDTCTHAHHVRFGEGANSRIVYYNGLPTGSIGWLNLDVYDKTRSEETAQGWCRPYFDLNGDGTIDPKLDRQVPAGGMYSVIPDPTDSTVVWGAVPGTPGRIVRLKTASCVAEAYEPPFNNPEAPGKIGFTPRGIDIDRAGIVWTALAGSGHLASFDRKKCTVLGGEAATSMQHCPQGWTLYPIPGPRMKGVTDDINSDFHYYNFVDQYNTFGMGENVPMASGTTSDALFALDKATGKVVTLRVPYPLGFYTRGLDGRIDDARAGWKGRGLWAVNGMRAVWHTEGGKGTPSQVAHFQLRPNPLAR